METTKRKPIRQGDVILVPISSEISGGLLSHLTLAKGEVTGHKHSICDGSANLYKSEDTLYLQVHSESATLGHEEHKPIQIPQGNWRVQVQREYEFYAERINETSLHRAVSD
jgi:hypothetical protein